MPLKALIKALAKQAAAEHLRPQTSAQCRPQPQRTKRPVQIADKTGLHLPQEQPADFSSCDKLL